MLTSDLHAMAIRLISSFLVLKNITDETGHGREKEEEKEAIHVSCRRTD